MVFRYSMGTFVVGMCALAATVPAASAQALATPAGAVVSQASHTSVRPLHAQTLADLNTAMRGEAFAHASYELFAAEAVREGLPAVGLLFRNTARTELNEHLAEAAVLAGTVGSDAANLIEAINGETYEHEVMYRSFAEQARADGDDEAADLFSEIAVDEGLHRDAFRAALTALTTGSGSIPAPPQATVVQVPAGPPKVKSARTLANLDTAMHGEALAYAKYMLFSAHAERGGDIALARLWAGTAAVELHEHFAGEAVLAGLVRTTETNLRTAIAGEHQEATTVYPQFAREAFAVGDYAAAGYFSHTAADEARHEAAFRRALNSLS